MLSILPWGLQELLESLAFGPGCGQFQSMHLDWIPSSLSKDWRLGWQLYVSSNGYEVQLCALRLPLTNKMERGIYRVEMGWMILKNVSVMWLPLHFFEPCGPFWVLWSAEKLLLPKGPGSHQLWQVIQRSGIELYWHCMLIDLLIDLFLLLQASWGMWLGLGERWIPTCLEASHCKRLTRSSSESFCSLHLHAGSCRHIQGILQKWQKKMILEVQWQILQYYCRM